MMALTDGLVSYWSLDEVSDGTAPVTRMDSHGSNHLTDNNNVASASGLLGRAAAFDETRLQYLSVSDNESFDFTSFTLMAWVAGGSETLLFNKDDLGSSRCFTLQTIGQGVHYAVTGTGTAGAINKSAEPLLILPWNLVLAWYEPGTMGLQVNGGEPFTEDIPGIYSNSQSPLWVGRRSNGYGQGTQDEAAIWSRVLTADERTFLYNNGAGRSYAEISGGGSTFSQRRKRFSP